LREKAQQPQQASEREPPEQERSHSLEEHRHQEPLLDAALPQAYHQQPGPGGLLE
jgi:hypothetical protein